MGERGEGSVLEGAAGGGWRVEDSVLTSSTLLSELAQVNKLTVKLLPNFWPKVAASSGGSIAQA